MSPLIPVVAVALLILIAGEDEDVEALPDVEPGEPTPIPVITGIEPFRPEDEEDFKLIASKQVLGVIRGLGALEEQGRAKPGVVPQAIVDALDYVTVPRANKFYQIQPKDNLSNVVHRVLGNPTAQERLAYMQAAADVFWNFALYGLAEPAKHLRLGCAFYPRHLPAEIFLRNGYLPDRVITDYNCSKIAGITGANSFGLLWMPGIDTDAWSRRRQLIITHPNPPMWSTIASWPIVRSV
jgi:hypothetical protein